MAEGQIWPYRMLNRASIDQIWPHRMADKGGLWPPNGHRVCQERREITLFATDFGARVPEIARAEPVTCQPNRVRGPQTFRGKMTAKKQNYANIGQKSLTHVQERNAPSSSAKLAPPLAANASPTQLTCRIFQRNLRNFSRDCKWDLLCSNVTLFLL
jgi:hypothetical protein